jgi:DNA processing protein
MVTTDVDVPSTAFTLALATLPDMGPARLRALTDGRAAAVAWREVLDGHAHEGPARPVMGPDAPTLSAAWARAAAETQPSGVWQAHTGAGVGVASREDDAYPEVLRDDPHGPALIVWSGSLDALDGPSAAIVGTRDCTHSGLEFAAGLARELTDAGVRVVSGLALGIDGAAHAGALSSGQAPPVGVVGSGLDVIYPRRNAALWRQVAERGVVLTEHPLGTGPAGWHFLARNRVIAALADAVVVVESHERGGALRTATEAAQRGRPVLAVPGSVRSPASVGTNHLIRDGVNVCCDALDVLTLLGLVHVPSARGDRRTPPTGSDAAVLETMGWEPCSVDALLLRTGLAVGELAGALERLEDGGWIVRRGGWCERIGPHRTGRAP